MITMSNNNQTFRSNVVREKGEKECHWRRTTGLWDGHPRYNSSAVVQTEKNINYPTWLQRSEKNASVKFSRSSNWTTKKKWISKHNNIENHWHVMSHCSRKPWAVLACSLPTTTTSYHTASNSTWTWNNSNSNNRMHFSVVVVPTPPLPTIIV